MKKFVILFCGVCICLLIATCNDHDNKTQLTNLPSVYIDTENGDTVFSKDHYTVCTLTWVENDNSTTYHNVMVKGRGNSTWNQSPQKPYRLKFAEKTKLLGKGFARAKNWVLLANHGDKTMIRNALTYDLGRFVGMDFCPASKFIDLFINNKYIGTYQISDKVEAGKHRVGIDRRHGILLETTSHWGMEENHFTTRRNFQYNIANPKNVHIGDQMHNRIKQDTQEMEDVIFSDHFADAKTGWQTKIDTESLVKWYVASEITGNLDALLVIYLYKNSIDDTFHFGPLWDMDFAYGLSGEVDMLHNLSADLNFEDRPWQQIFQRLWKDPSFADAVDSEFNNLLNRGLEDFLMNHIDSLATVISQSQKQNFQVWNISQPVYSWEKHVYHDNYQAYIDDLKSFIHVHLQYIKQRFHELHEQASR